MGLVALRDVEAGEEILINYDGSGFLRDKMKPWFQLLKRDAWGEIADAIFDQNSTKVEKQSHEADNGSTSKLNEKTFKEDRTDIFSCHVREKPFPIWVQETWEHVQDMYRRSVGVENSSINPGPSTSGMYVPHAVRWFSEKKRRGVFLTKRVRKGQLVWKPTQRAKFVEE
eukprot:scaffold288580_cov32-Attheya_sp.AAC.1